MSGMQNLGQSGSNMAYGGMSGAGGAGVSASPSGSASALAQLMSGAPGTSNGNMGLQVSTQPVRQPQPTQQMPPWMSGGGQQSQSPVQLNAAFGNPAQYGAAFGQGQSSANPSNTTATYPTLSGGYYNQMTQALAGPQYTTNVNPATGTNAGSGGRLGSSSANAGMPTSSTQPVRRGGPTGGMLA